MKLIIDIDEDITEGAKSSPNYYPIYHFEKMWKAIINGTPLDNLKAEIEHLTITEGGEDYTRKMAELYSLKIKILQIIDKYKGGDEK